MSDKKTPIYGPDGKVLMVNDEMVKCLKDKDPSLKNFSLEKPKGK